MPRALLPLAFPRLTKNGSPRINPSPVQPKKVSTPEPKPVLRDGKPVTIRNIKDRECHWMRGPAAPDSQMCANPVAKGGSYCKHHAERCFNIVAKP